MSRAQLLARPETRLPEAALDQLECWAKRRRQGEPMAYLLGRKEFWGLDLHVGRAVLIPRPETELLVSLALAALRPGDRLLDLGTGSGAIAIAVAKSGPEKVSVTASDCSPAALTLARQNAKAHDVEVSWVQSDWFARIAGAYQIILSNPPYIAENDPHLAALAHEPVTALCGGPDGLADIRRIVAEAPAHIAPGGCLMIEHGFDQGAPVRSLMSAAGLLGIETLRDLAGHERVTRGKAPERDG